MITYKWDAILTKIESFKSDIPTEKELLNFNNDPIPFVNDFYDVKSDTTISILFLGNSITLCTMPEEEPDKTERGLTSTSLSKDFVHKLVTKLSDRYSVNVRYSIGNISEFERCFNYYDFDFENRIKRNLTIDPDWLIIQIGENISEKDLSSDTKYRKDFTRLLSLFPNSKKIVTIPFWPSKSKQMANTRVALDNDCYLVDLSHLGNGTDPSNFANSQRKYANPGVGKHPGDIGMENISNAIFAIMQASQRNIELAHSK